MTEHHFLPPLGVRSVPMREEGHVDSENDDDGHHVQNSFEQRGGDDRGCLFFPY